MRTNSPNTGKSKPWQFMKMFTIYASSGEVYLQRLRIIDTPFFGIFLHKFMLPDSDPWLHDHPWSFVSFVLRGGYREMRRDNLTRRKYSRRVRFVNVMRRDDAHYVYALERTPTWTLVLHGRRRRTWGFSISYPGYERWIEFDQMANYKESQGWV